MWFIFDFVSGDTLTYGTCGPTSTSFIFVRYVVHFFSDSGVSNFPADLLFKIIIDVENYPKFVPWCKGAKVLSIDGQTMKASLDVKFGMISKSYISNVTWSPPSENSLGWVKAEALPGVFSHMASIWKLTNIKNKATTLIEFEISFQFKSPIMNKLAFIAQKNAYREIVSAFKKRAEALYGHP